MSEERSVLVTGGAGFIGSHVVDRLLDQGWQVTALDNFDPYYDASRKRRNIRSHLDRPGYRFLEVDICDLEGMRREVPGAPDAVVHLAARPGVRASLQDPMASERINVKGTTALLELAREREIPHFVFGSSSSVYGVNPSVPWREDDEVLLPISPYAATKVSGELLGHVYSRLFGIRFLALRFFTVFGPRQRPDLAIHKFAVKMLKGEPVPLYGTGDTRRDYTFVGDIVTGIRAALDWDADRYGIVNLGCGRTVTLMEMVRTLEEVLGIEAQVRHEAEQPGDVPQTWADISRARDWLGYEPATTLAEGVAAFRSWLLEEEGHLRP